MRYNVYEFALMSRFLELASRYGVEHWELPIDYDTSTGKVHLVGTPSRPEGYRGFCEMVKALGIDDPTTTGVFPQEEGRDMLTALDEAIRTAPRKRMR